jgi:hypothetical protein
VCSGVMRNENNSCLNTGEYFEFLEENEQQKER